jgi:GNAT superfamily N-acetyltransferase
MPRHPPALFRQAAPADIPAMAAIRLAVTENVLSDPGRITHAMYEDYLDATGRGWVAEIDGAIVAFSYADKDKGSIWALFVHPGHEGRGLASVLLRLATDWLFGLGHDAVTLTTGAGTRADRFYARQGWRRTPLDATDIAYTLARPTAPATP